MLLLFFFIIFLFKSLLIIEKKKFFCQSLFYIRTHNNSLHSIIEWMLSINTSFKFEGSTQTSSHTPSHAHTNTHTFTTCMPVVREAPLSLPFHFFFLSVPLLQSLYSHPPFLPKASFKEYTHHFITLMNLVGFSRRGRPLVMQRQMPPVPPSAASYV